MIGLLPIVAVLSIGEVSGRMTQPHVLYSCQQSWRHVPGPKGSCVLCQQFRTLGLCLRSRGLMGIGFGDWLVSGMIRRR